MNKSKLTINILANAIFDPEASGSDRIFVECAKRWAQKGHKVCVYTWKEGYEMCKKHRLDNVHYKVTKSKYKKISFPLLYLTRIIEGCIKALTIDPKDVHEESITYSSTDFFPDTLPAFIMKKRFNNFKWIAGLYLFAPNPFKNSSDVNYRGGRMPFSLRNLVYYLSQRVSYYLIKQQADFILVANELDKRIFVKDGIPNTKVMPVYGGVNITAISQIPPQKLKYDGCFVGRLHPQKGPLELIRIWHLICKVIPEAKLALIGEGPLRNEVRNEINKMNLVQNVKMLGWVDGDEKYKILKSGKVFLHTPILDTGGMAAAEGMACGLPVIGFDLPGYKFCYPKGMLKAQIGDLKAFAGLVLTLLQDKKSHYQVKKTAIEFSKEWDWDKRSQDILDRIKMQGM